MNSSEFLIIIRKHFIYYFLIFFLFISGMMVLFKILFGEFNYLLLGQLEEEVIFLEENNKNLNEKNRLLKEEKNKLLSGRRAIEGMARSELGLIKPGETFYQFKKEEELIKEIPENRD